MNRLLFSIAILLASTHIAIAIPARKGTIRLQQPDGSYVAICLHGDEFLHFNTTDDGYSVVKDSRGYYVYAELENGRLVPTAQVAHETAARNTEEKAYLQSRQKYLAPERVHPASRKQAENGNKANILSKAPRYDYNKFRGLIILVEYNDKKFSRPDYKDILEAMVNQENYTGYDSVSCTGSVYDYFCDNSNGKFKPHFDIAGPYTVSYSQYDAQGGYNSEDVGYDPYAQIRIANAALDAADADVDFSQYDGDGDGFVDLIFLILAGNGANYTGNNKGLWWPHRWNFFNPDTGDYIRKDSVILSDYASATELCGYTNAPSTIQLDGIGTICHEFSHVLGLPDFYDVDYDGSGGRSNDPGDWSVMANGCYMGAGFTPIGYSLYERYRVGFIDELPTITEEGDYTLEPLASSLSGYRLDTPVADEFFLVENRQKNAFKWDTYLPGNGMLVHRVDLTNPSVWSNNSVNNNPHHNYYEVVRADGPHTAGIYYVSSPADAFPGTKNVTELTNSSSPASLKTWGGQDNKYAIANITQNNNGNITFTVSDYQLTVLKLPRSMDLNIGVTRQVEVSAEPTYADYTLTWKSSDESVATVDAEGMVTGIALGTCIITATSNNNLSASCTVTVTAVPEYGIAEFKQQPIGTEAVLKLDHAQVLFAYTKSNVKTAYLRDESGAIMLYDTDLDLKTGDILTGSVFVQKTEVNGVPQASSTDAASFNDSVEISEGGEVQPREVTFEELNAEFYSDLVLVKGVRLMWYQNHIYAYSEQDINNRARMSRNFNISSGLTSSTVLDDKYFNVTAIYGVDVDGEQIVNNLNITKAVEDVTETMGGILELRTDQDHIPAYNLSGQKVGSTYNGLVIKGGKKHLTK